MLFTYPRGVKAFYSISHPYFLYSRIVLPFSLHTFSSISTNRYTDDTSVHNQNFHREESIKTLQPFIDRQEVLVKEKLESMQIRKKLTGQQGPLTKAIPSPESRHDRSLIFSMKYTNQILKFLRTTCNEDIVIYAVAIKKCSELKDIRAIFNVIDIVEQRKIQLDGIFCTQVLHQLGIWEKFRLQQKYFKKWFTPHGKNTLLLPNLITLNTMIQGCASTGDVKQALEYLRLLVQQYNLKPNEIVCTTLLSVCANACDMKSAELIWNRIQQDKDIKMNKQLISCMLNVYSKCGEVDKMMKLLKFSQRPEQFIPINEIECTTIMAGLLKVKKIQEMFNFYENEIPKLSLKNSINIKNYKIIGLRCIGHLNMMEMLNVEDTNALSFHHQQFMKIFHQELYPKLNNHKPTQLQFTNIDLLLQSYIILHKKNWMDAVKDVERILFKDQRYIHPFQFLSTENFDKKQLLLNFRGISTNVVIFLLRYIFTFRREDLKKNWFPNGSITILCGKGLRSRVLNKKKMIESNGNPMKKIIENELNQWKVKIRIEQNPENLGQCYLNESDVSLLFKTVPPFHDCLKS